MKLRDSFYTGCQNKMQLTHSHSIIKYTSRNLISYHSRFEKLLAESYLKETLLNSIFVSLTLYSKPASNNRCLIFFEQKDVKTIHFKASTQIFSLIQQAMDKITEIKIMRNEKRSGEL